MIRRAALWLSILGLSWTLGACAERSVENTVLRPRSPHREVQTAPAPTAAPAPPLGLEFAPRETHEAERSVDDPIVASPSKAKPAPRFLDADDGRPRRDAFRKELSDEELLVIERRRAGFSDTPRGGEMWAKTAERTLPMPLKHTDVKAQVSIYVGSVTVTQQYHNPYDSKIEALYVFPLPDDAAIREFVMKIGERRIRGVIREREEAQRIYREARARGHVASLLTQERPNIFTQNVANIDPGKAIDVAITYFHTMRQVDGVFEFVFPMVVGPRYNPPGSVGGVGAVPAGATGTSGQKTEVQYLPPDVVTAHDIALEVDVECGLPIQGLHSPTHDVDVKRLSETRSVVTLGRHDRIPNKDFVLRWTPGGTGVRSAVASHRDETGGYFTVMLHPPTLEELPAVPREMIFVLDCSGSMNGWPLETAKTALERCLRRLSPTDTFQIINFSTSASRMGAAPVPATPANIQAGLRYLRSLTSEGGTEMITGIRAALDFPHAPGRFRIVSFMTDGYIGNEAQILAEVQKRLGPARIFSFGIGTSVNRYLIEGLARVGRGVAAYVLQDAASQEAVDGLYRRIERPALTDLRIDAGGPGAVELYPSPLPDLFAGRPVVVTGRFRGEPPARLRIEGRAAGREWTSEIALRGDTKHPALAAVWARAKIASVHDRLATGTEPSECVQEIKATALRYGLMSEFTSFVAIDSLSKTGGAFGTTVVQPVPVPKGVRYETTVGENR
ncbi:MAG TPA: VIT domain-containing protein [Planctomycetota bacterium]|nr:VIT domain-containing protein [Planctomycetota bacterium]